MNEKTWKVRRKWEMEGGPNGGSRQLKEVWTTRNVQVAGAMLNRPLVFR